MNPATAVSARIHRFFRGEALNRWRDLSPDDVLGLTGDREELIAFLQDRYGLAPRRAGLEADAFISGIEDRIRCAVRQNVSDVAPNAFKLSA